MYEIFEEQFFSQDAFPFLLIVVNGLSLHWGKLARVSEDNEFNFWIVLVLVGTRKDLFESQTYPLEKFGWDH